MNSTPLLSPDLAAFIQGPMAIALSATDTGGHPRLARGGGCLVAPDRQRITVFVDREKSQPLLSAALERDFLAAVFCLPGPEQAVQIKGDAVTVTELTVAEQACQLAYRQQWCRQLATLGYTDAFSLATVAWPVQHLLALSFTPRATFNQTPGPKAGATLTEGAL